MEYYATTFLLKTNTALFQVIQSPSTSSTGAQVNTSNVAFNASIHIRPWDEGKSVHGVPIGKFGITSDVPASLLSLIQATAKMSLDDFMINEEDVCSNVF